MSWVRSPWLWALPGLAALATRLVAGGGDEAPEVRATTAREVPMERTGWAEVVREGWVLSPELMLEQHRVERHVRSILRWGGADAAKRRLRALESDELGRRAARRNDDRITEALAVAALEEGDERLAIELYGHFADGQAPEWLEERIGILAPPREPSTLRFEDATETLGVQHLHRQRAGEAIASLGEAYGSGVALIDLDDDGRLDLFLLGAVGVDGPPNRLYRNLGDRFEDMTAGSGLADTGHSLSVAAADLDGDGLPELFVGNRGRSRLYTNLGGLRFEERPLPDPGWQDTLSAGAAFGDIDGDGDLDLYVARHVVDRAVEQGPTAEAVYARMSRRSQFSPYVYAPASNLLFRNEGDHFTEVATELGVDDPGGRSLSVALVDLDGHPGSELFVANDASPNSFWLNDGAGGFVDASASARLHDHRSAMGIAVADLDTDGAFDLLLTNYRSEYNALFANRLAEGSFSEITDTSGLREGSLGVTGWGVVVQDFDLDGDADVAIANGLPDTFGALEARTELDPGTCIAEPQLLYERRGERFHEVSGEADALAELTTSARGLVSGDIDRDGRPDLVVTANHGRARVLLNRSSAPGHWLVVRPRGDADNRLAVGAVVEVEVDEHLQRAVVLSGTSYLSQGPFELTFGLSAPVADRVQITWPDGRTTELTDVAADRVLQVTAQPS